MNKYFNLNDPNLPKSKGLENPSILHRCPFCSGYLWSDKNHRSYNFCVYCGRNLKNKQLPYEYI